MFKYYKKMLTFLNQNKDKQIHMFYFYFGIMMFYTFFGITLFNILLTFAITLIGGYCKEKIDVKITGLFCKKDMIANMIGWTLATLHMLLIILYKGIN